MAEVDLSKRQFLNTAINAVGAVITAILAVPLTGYFIDPAIPKAGAGSGADNWVKLTSLDKVTGDPVEYAFSTVRVEGYMKQEVSAKAYVWKDGGDKYVAMSNICTHLGCPAGWNAGEGKFVCPCHGSFFDREGNRIAGPAPKPLPRYATKTENGELFIKVV